MVGGVAVQEIEDPAQLPAWIPVATTIVDAGIEVFKVHERLRVCIFPNRSKAYIFKEIDPSPNVPSIVDALPLHVFPKTVKFDQLEWLPLVHVHLRIEVPIPTESDICNDIVEFGVTVEPAAGPIVNEGRRESTVPFDQTDSP